jgi:HPt (histidine-containing phosphotransfer) domain-containing protein
LAESDSDSEPKLPGPKILPETFATIDTDRREYALAALNVQSLAQAAEVIEQQAREPKPLAPPEVVPPGFEALLAAAEIPQYPQPPQMTISADGPPNGPPMPPPYPSNLSSQRVATDSTVSPQDSIDAQGIS